MIRSILVVALILSLPLATPARAASIAEEAAIAERLAAEGRQRDAWEVLQRAADQLWAVAPLEMRRLLFVAVEPQGYGVYEVRPDNRFKAGETLVVYGEPFGYAFGRDGEIRTIEFEVRLHVTTLDGQVAIPSRAGSLALKSRRDNKEFMITFQYTPQGLKAGDYVLVADFRDTHSNKTTSARLPFRME